MLPKTPGTSPSSREFVQIAIMAGLVLVIVGWWAVERQKTAGPEAERQYLIEEMLPDDPTIVSPDEVQRLRESGGTQQGEGSASEWRARSPEEISPEDYSEIIRQERDQEREFAQFRPMLDAFEPLLPDAYRVFRARIIERLPTGIEIVFTLPGQSGEHRVISANVESLSAAGPDGARVELRWRDIPAGSMLEMARQVARLEGNLAEATDALHLTNLARLAGSDDLSAEFAELALELDPEIGDRLAEGPRTSLSLAILDEFSWSWDDPHPMRSTPRAATSFRGDAPSIFHVYQYMRTIGEDALRSLAERQAPYEQMVSRPMSYRGKVFTVEGRFIRRFMATRWVQIEGSERAGIRDLDFVFVLDAEWGGVYLVSIPRDSMQIGDSDLVRFTGVFIRRWPYRSDGEWRWIPWIAAMDLEPVNIGPGAGFRALSIGIFAVFVLGVVAIYIIARRESKDDIARTLRHARQRGRRDHIRAKAAEAEAKAGKPDEEKSEAKDGGPDKEDGA